MNVAANAGVEADEGVIVIDDKASIQRFVTLVKGGRLWERQPELRSPG